MARSEIIRRRTISFVIQSAVMVLGIVAMLIFFFVIESKIPEAIGNKKLGLLRIAWITSGLAWLTGILLVWSVMRYYRFLNSMSHPDKKMVYVDAWAEAGRRFQVEEPSPDDENEPDSNDQD